MSASAISSRSDGRLLGAQVQHDAALAAVDVDEDPRHAGLGSGRDVAGVVACGGFHLDHVGAHVGHDLGAIRPHDHGGEIDHAHPYQRAVAFGLAIVQCSF